MPIYYNNIFIMYECQKFAMYSIFIVIKYIIGRYLNFKL